MDMARHQPCKHDWRGWISIASTDLARPVALNSFRQRESIVSIGSAKLLLSYTRGDFKMYMARHQPCKHDWRGQFSLASTDLSRPVALNSFRQRESIVDIGSAKLLLSHIRGDFKFDMARTNHASKISADGFRAHQQTLHGPVALNSFRQRVVDCVHRECEALLSYTRGDFKMDIARHQPCKHD